MDELRQRLLRQKTDFEKKYGIGSEEFNRRYEKGAMGDDQVEDVVDGRIIIYA